MKAAIFDMDGTLVDSLNFHLQAYLNISKKHNIGMGKDFVYMRFGMTAKEIFSEYATQNELEVDVDQLATEKFREFDRIAQNIPILPGATELLEKLKKKGLKLVIASGSGRLNVDTVINRTGIAEYFDFTVAGDEVPRGKEFPDIWLKAAELVGEEPKDCIVFEDAYYGAQSAKEAGMMVVGILSGSSSLEELAPICDFVINNLAEFGKIADQI